MTRFEWGLWGVSVAAVVASFLVFSNDYLTLAASVTGVTSLIYAAKGNVLGPALMIVFSVLYGVISCLFGYYGEMMTYVGMTLPMSVVSLISWVRHPFRDSAQVTVAKVSKKAASVMIVLSVLVTVGFYFVLRALGNANLLFSTFSVTTSFAAAFLTFLRSPYFALAYALNDAVLIVLWSLASVSDLSYIPMIVCFGVFLINDTYGFLSWRKMAKMQSQSARNGQPKHSPEK